MKLLVDAHTLIWAVDDPSKLGPQAVTALQDPANDLLIAIAPLLMSQLNVDIIVHR